MKIALLNSVLLNGGDAGIAYGTIDAILSEAPDAEVTVFTHQAAAAALYYPDLRIRPMIFDRWPTQRYVRAAMRVSFRFRNRLRWLTAAERAFFHELSAVDAIVYCGGGYINDFYNSRIVLDVIEATLSLDIPHIAYAHSVGPLIKKDTLKRVSKLLTQFRLVTTRDLASSEILIRAGVRPGCVHLLADAAFFMRQHSAHSLPDWDQQSLEGIARFKHEGGSRPFVMLSVRKWRFPAQVNAAALADSFRREIRRLVGRLLDETDCQICFISTCQGRPEYGYDDSAVAMDVLEGLDVPTGRVMVCRESFSPRTYPYLIQAYADVVISMRMHFAIFAILAETPFIAIAYERKSHELCLRIGMSDYCHDAAGMNADSVMRSVVSALTSRVALKQTLSRAVRSKSTLEGGC